MRDLVRAARPSITTTTRTRELGAEAAAPRLRKKRDLVRTPDGRYIKGFRPGGAVAKTSVGPQTNVVGESRAAAPADRVSFAVRNLAGWIEAGLARVSGAGDDEVIELSPGDVQREVQHG